MNNRRFRETKPYRENNSIHQPKAIHRWFVWILLLVSVAVQMMPWPKEYLTFKPNWVLLSLVYWIIALPYQISIGTAFFLGCLMDLLTGSALGVRALVLSVIAYLAAFRFQLVRNLAVWQQAIIVMLLSAFYELSVFSIEFLLNNQIHFQPASLFSALIDGILWPFVYLVLRFLSKKLNIH